MNGFEHQEHVGRCEVMDTLKVSETGGGIPTLDDNDWGDGYLVSRIGFVLFG